MVNINCTETWLDNRVPSNLLKLNNMTVFRNDRRTGLLDYHVHINGGGVCIFVSRKWVEFSNCIPDYTITCDDFETIAITITRPNFRKLMICCVYKPPKGKIEKCIKLLKEMVNKYKALNYEIWLLGDFNTDLLRRDNVHTADLVKFAKVVGLTQLINDVTRPNQRGGSCIDLIFTDCSYVIDKGILNDMIADHFSVFAVRKKSREKKDSIVKTVRDYTNFDEINFERLLKNINWDTFDNHSDPNYQWELIHGYTVDILSIMCPYKRIVSRKKVTPWITPEIYTASREKKRLIKAYRVSKDSAILCQARIQRNIVNGLIEKAKTEFILNSLNSNAKKPKKFWRIINSLIDEQDSVDITSYIFRDIITHDPISKEDTPDFLNSFFVEIAERTRTRLTNQDAKHIDLYPDIISKFDFAPPELEDMYGYMMEIDINTSSCLEGINSKLCKILIDKIPEKFRHLFANSLFFGIFPEAWTSAYVTLIPKEGDRNSPGNWRPISQTVIFAKILEKIVHKQLLKYLLENKIISPYQYGFLPGKSTQEAVFKTVTHMYSSINQNKVMGVLFLDVAKAFNCIDHDLLYRKFKDVGMSMRAIHWFKTYLTRSQVVRYGDTISNILPLNVGIAQGTVLGPLIFIFYINDCTKVLNRVRISMFADDCILYYSGNVWRTEFEILRGDLNNFVDWNTKNMLKLNGKKTQAMIVGTRNKLSKLKNPRPFLILNQEVKYVSKYSYLGIVLDSELSLAPLCKSIENRVSNKVYVLRKIRRYITYKAAIQIYKQMILPFFDYAGFLLVACNKDKKGDLQVIQNDALRFCDNTHRNDRVLLEILHNKAKLSSLEQRRSIQLLQLMYKLSKNNENRVIGTRNTRQNEKYVFRMDSKIGNKYSHSPYYKGCKLWNALPRETQLLNSTSIFKHLIKPMYKVFDKNYLI